MPPSQPHLVPSWWSGQHFTPSVGSLESRSSPKLLELGSDRKLLLDLSVAIFPPWSPHFPISPVSPPEVFARLGYRRPGGLPASAWGGATSDFPCFTLSQCLPCPAFRFYVWPRGGRAWPGQDPSPARAMALAMACLGPPHWGDTTPQHLEGPSSSAISLVSLAPQTPRRAHGVPLPPPRTLKEDRETTLLPTPPTSKGQPQRWLS